MINFHKFDNFFLQWIIFIITIYIILLMDWTGINGIIYGIIIFVVGSIICYAIIKIIESNLVQKKKHKKELIEKILRPLYELNIRHKKFKIWIEGLDNLMKRDEFIWAKHHLQHKSYSNILTNLEKVNELIGNLNIKLKNLEEHMDNKIDTQYRDGLSHYLGDIVQSVFYNDTEVDYIKIKEVKENEIHILRNETECIKIPCIFGVEKTKEVISNIIEQLEFKKRLLEIQNINNELKKDFWEPFEKFLKLILDNYERKSKLKGRCEECSRLYKYFDC